MPWTPPPKEKKRRLNPIWGGVGLILFPLYLLGSYYLAVFLVDQNRANGWFFVPGEFTHLQQTAAVAVAIFFLSFALMSIAWSVLRGPVGGPTDIHYSKHRRLKKRY
jgi:hypothetical protein